MDVQDRLARSRVRLERAWVDVSLALLHRAGPRPPVVFLHGFGSTKEDYAGTVARFVDRADAGGGRW